jgi:hypothetical protein
MPGTNQKLAPPEEWPEIGYDAVAQRYGAEVDFDQDEFSRLLDDLGVGPEEREMFGGIEFVGSIYTLDGSHPTGRYDVNEMKTYIRVLKRSIKTLFTRKEEVRKPEKINKDLVHEVRHFYQHLGHIACGVNYSVEIELRRNRNAFDDDAYDFAKKKANEYAIITAAHISSPKAHL